MIPAAWHDEFETAIRCIAPELPLVYVLEHPAHLPRPNCSAYCPIVVSPTLQQHLESIVQWQGPGAMIVLVETPSSFELALPTVLHELSHALPCRVPIHEPEPSAELIEADRRAYRKMSVSMRDSARPPWYGHGSDFIRTAIHVCFRAIWHRHYSLLDLESMTVAGEYYGLSPVRLYRQALGDEPSRMIGASFGEILASPAPDAFSKLFESDIARWRVVA